MKPERKIIRELRLDEISAVVTPAQSHAIATIMKSADGHDRAKPVTALKNIKIDELSLVEHGANQFANVTMVKSADPVPVTPVTFHPTAEGLATIEKLAAIYQANPIHKSTEEAHNMSNSKNYDEIVRKYASAQGISIQKAAEKLLNDDPQAVADAYDQDEAELVARRFAEASRR